MMAYQRTAALKAAIDLELFTAVGEGLKTVSKLAQRCETSERGIRMLCDFMVIAGFLTKSENSYHATAESAAFLDKKSRAYVGSATKFLASPLVTDGFKDLAAVIRSGRPLSDQPFSEGENPIWADFARSMAPLAYLAAQETEKLVRSTAEITVLDIAAGHGLFGIAVAQHNPRAKVVALDWPSVLAVANENAQRFGVSGRYKLLPGDALEVAYETGFDLVLVTNLLHHWDRITNERFLGKVHKALAPKGRVAVVEFVPNDDRISPPIAASFVLNMLANTTGGDAYTVSEHQEMLVNAGFSACELHSLSPTPLTAIIATKE
jgi:ubiquinone/menaquinone biosynthesis C-methylase UbiE